MNYILINYTLFLSDKLITGIKKVRGCKSKERALNQTKQALIERYGNIKMEVKL